MNKQDIYDLLEKKGIWCEKVEHEAVFNMEDLAKVDLPYPEADAKNVFVRDDKKKNYYLITIGKDKRVDLKKFQENHNTRKLSFVSENSLKEILDLIPGSVSPFGLLNDKECKVKFYLDKDFIANEGIIGIHPNDNTATVFLKTNDLIDVIKEHGNKVEIIRI